MLGKVRESARGPLAGDPAGNQKPGDNDLPVIGISNTDATAPRLRLGRIGQRGPEPATLQANKTLDQAHRRSKRAHR